ncbi:MAG: hypothetical protein HGA87_01015 [Desulfobulbaceae bacterium]|nr:hypothetical protein [Desulfobulbaceae bacterium]
MTYQGEERRTEHCDVHLHNTTTLEANSNALAGILSGVSVLKWTVGIGFTALIAGFSIFLPMANAKLDGTITKLTELNSSVHQIASGQRLTDNEVANVKLDVAELRERICYIEGRKRK